VHIDISILTPASTISYSDGLDLIRQLRPGVDGVILRHGSAGATFLPQVWDQLPQPEQFLGHLCRKAGLSERTWRDSHPEILVYQVQCFAEEEV
jgi:AMMECR1 domain-containing protein